MVIKAVNNTVGYNDLVFILLVFGIFLRITNNDAFTLFITERTKIISITIAEISKFHVTK